MIARIAIILAIFAVGGCGGTQPRSNNVALSPALLEVSGLAAASENSVFAHNDEHAIVHEIDVETGRATRIFALGDPTIEGDFEGIAVAAGMIYLVTSDGLIYAAIPGRDGERVAYRTHDSGVGPLCEVEGLTNAPDGGYLLLLCKRLRRGQSPPRLEIHRWRLGTEHAEPEPWLSIPLDSFLSDSEAAELGPSGIEWDSVNERFLIVSGRSQLLISIDRQGNVIETRQLQTALHPKAEGIAILPACRLLLADEGGETRRARLANYPCPD